MSQGGTKCAAMAAGPVQHLTNFGETGSLSEQDEALADITLCMSGRVSDQQQLLKHLTSSEWRTTAVLHPELTLSHLQAVSSEVTSAEEPFLCAKHAICLEYLVNNVQTT